MKILCLDIGNSKSTVAVVEDRHVTDWFRYEYGHESDGHPMAELYEWCRIREETIGGVMVASVVPALSKVWKSVWERGAATRRLPLREVSQTSSLPFVSEIGHPETVGADRWCNLSGAVSRGHRNALVVDLGTANTFDLLWEGRFTGGVIAPGLVVSHQQFLRSGALLPELDFMAPKEFPGRETASAIRGGSWLQGWGGVAAVIKRFLREHPALAILVTGGMGRVLFESPGLLEELGLQAERAEHLTLEGAAVLYELEEE